MWQFFYKLASAKTFYQITQKLLPWCAAITCLLLSYGLAGGLVLAPSDYQQGDAYRIIYIHVPSAFLSMLIYSVMAFTAILTLVWRIKLAEIIMTCSAKLGAWMTFLALVTGSLWGKPMWGTWWIWDARLTSELILLFLYLGIITLQSSLGSNGNAAKLAAILVLVGTVNLPVIHYSVYWWNTLHQGATISRLAKPAIAPAMLYPLLAMLAAFVFYYITALLLLARYEVIQRERKASWIKQLIQ